MRQTNLHQQLPFFLCCFLLFTFTSNLFSQEVFINEFLASNDSQLTDEFGEFDDWVELYNPGNQAIDVGGWYITDDLLTPTTWQIPTTDPAATTIPAGGYLVLWCDKQPEQGVLHVNIKLSSSGEDLALFASDGITEIDSYTFGTQLSNITEGRVPDGASSWDFFSEPTPGAANSTPPGVENAEEPIASIDGGFYSTSVSVSLSPVTAGSTIYYTLDGSDPTDNSEEYLGPITITSTTPLRAIAYSADLLPSSILTHTYFIDVSHSFAIVAVTSNDENFFGPDGLYTNITEDIEIPMNIEFFEPDGTLGFNQILETELQGTASATLAQKSLGFKAKSSLGSSVINYQIFPDLEFEQLRSFVVRNSGQDWNITMFRDAMVSSLARDLSDVGSLIDYPDLDHQAYRPGVVYYNGVYWGIHNIRERMDKRYLRVHYGLDDDQIDLLDDFNEVKEGDIVHWDALQNFLLGTNLADNSNFEELATRVDVDGYTDNLVFNLFIDNQDWPGNNNRRWRERSEDGKWRWMIKDLDFSFGLYTSNGWNTGYAGDNSLARLLTSNGYIWPNQEWSTRLFRGMIQNEEWKASFINRMADQLNVLYSPERILERIDDFQTAYTPEIGAHVDRWFSGYLLWQENIDKMRAFASNRRSVVQQQFIDAFPEISGTEDVSVLAVPSNGGEVRFSTVNLDETNLPWTGTYFDGIEIPVVAKPARGYVFQYWTGPIFNTNTSASFTLDGPTTIAANFITGSTATDPIVINEINYNSPDDPNSGDWVELYNPNNTAVDISGWYFEDESGEYFGLPANTFIPAGGYLVLVESVEEFSAVYPTVTNILGDFGGDDGFKLSGGGELIELLNADGVVIDFVDYDDNSPWPTAADGDGPTLQLIDPALDNALASSWQALLATPGGENSASQLLDQNISFPFIADQLTTSEPFPLFATASSGLQVGFDILSGPATLSGNILTLSGQAGTVVVQASQEGDDNYNAAPIVAQSFEVIDDNPPTDYCVSGGQQPWQQWISSIQIADLNNVSFKEQYGDFTNLVANVDAGNTYDISLTPGFSGQQFNEYWSIWIDYNQDGDFEDAGELVFQDNGNSFISGSITIAATAPTGQTRMRVSMKNGAYATPCEIFTFGETEDYTINIGENNGGGDGPDLELNLTVADPNFSIYNIVDYTLSVTNTGTEAMSGISIDFPLADGLVFASQVESKGVYSNWTGAWRAIDLDVGETATLNLSLFTLVGEGSITSYAQVMTATPDDIDSTPANGTPPNAVEDDEAVITITASNNRITNFEIGIDQHRSIILNNIYPIPADELLTLSLFSKKDNVLQMTIYNVAGQKFLSQQLVLKEGMNDLPIDISTLTSGAYTILFETSNGHDPIRFIKQRK